VLDKNVMPEEQEAGIGVQVSMFYQGIPIMKKHCLKVRRSRLVQAHVQNQSLIHRWIAIPLYL
jgi:hypothetical protein